MRTTLDKFGRIVIPMKMRKDLGIEPGAEVSVEEHGQTICVKPVQEVPAVAMKEGILIYRGAIVGDIEQAVADDRKRRNRTLGKGLMK